MGDSSDEDVPLFQRNPAFMLGKQKAVVLSSDEDSPLPSWLQNHKPAAVDDPDTIKHSNSSDSDVKEVMSPVKLISPSKKRENPLLDHDITQHPKPSTLTTLTETHEFKDNGHVAAVASHEKPKSAPAPTKNISSIPVMIPDKLSQLKVLIELESKDEIHGATDLSGDSGSIGRLIVNPSNKQVQIDLKGILYNATRVSTPMTMAVVNISQIDAKVECIFNDFLQLREDATFAQVMGAGSTALFDGLLGGDDEDDERYGAAAGDDEKGDSNAGGKKKKVPAGVSAKGKGRGGASGSGGTKRKPAGGARKPRAGAVKKTASGKSKAISKK